ncbi:MAG: hypothetical protein WB290_17710 [Smithella sp.]
MEKTKNKKSKAVNPPIIRNWKDWINYQYPALLKLGARLIDSENALKKYTEIPNTGFALDILKTKVIMLNERTSKTLLNQNKKSLEDLLVNINLKQYGIDRNDFENKLDKARNCDITDTGSLNKLGTWCFFLAELCHEFRMEYRIGNDINKECYEAITRLFLICGDITGRAYEAIGYWTAKLEHKKRSKNQETKQQQEAIKEEYVTNAYLNLIKDEKKIFANLSQNKIAKRIYDYVFPLLKDKKTATGKFVLTRTKKIDKEGKTILSGLSTDTIIAIMRRQDKFTFNPFKNNASK